MRKYIRIYRLFLAQYLKTLMQSKVDFWMGFLAFFAFQAFGILFLWVIFSQIPSLAGWSFYEILFIYPSSLISDILSPNRVARIHARYRDIHTTFSIYI